MHIYEKNIDGKRYLTEIPNCVCVEKSGDEYRLLCHLQQRGIKFYRCTKDAEFLWQDVGKKSLNPVGNAKKKVLEELARFESDTAESELSGFIKAVFPGTDIVLFIRRRSKKTFDAVMKYTNRDGIPTIRRIANETIGGIIHEMRCSFVIDKKSQDLVESLLERGAIADNPILKAALGSGDELLVLQIKLYYNVADKSDCKRLSELLGVRVLPPLGKEHDRYYVIPFAEMDRTLLHDSGYSCSHVPYFAMKGYTHSLWRVNPYAKSIIDAAGKDEETISFEAFLKIFESDAKYNERIRKDGKKSP